MITIEQEKWKKNICINKNTFPPFIDIFNLFKDYLLSISYKSRYNVHIYNIWYIYLINIY